MRDATGSGGSRRLAPLDTERFRSAFEDSAIGMAIEDLDGRVLHANPVLCTMLGYGVDELVGMYYQDICHPDDLEGPEYLESLRAGVVRRVTRECRYRRADGSVIWVRAHIGVIADQDQVVCYAVQIEDITAGKEAEAKLMHQAYHDTLTDLPNRAALAVHVADALARGDRPALLFVNLDRFKLVNDTLGHAAGDALLIAVAQRLRCAVRDSDILARIGGDEFVVLGTASSLADAQGIAERLQASLAEPFTLLGRQLFLTASIGIALPEAPASTAEDTLRAADLAMYRAKITGKARTVVFDTSMHDDAQARLSVEQDLHRALAQAGQLRAWFQPVLSVTTERVVSVEALLRWHHPRRGLLLPADFLAIAEDSGLMPAISRAVLIEATAQARRWRDQGLEMMISVNLSGRTLDEATVLDDVADALSLSGLDPTHLCIEVAEGFLGEPYGRRTCVLEELRATGVAVAIDDFAETSSPISYLRHHPVDVIKFGPSFVSTVASNPRDAAIVRGVIELAHALGMTCVATGVERADQLRHLTELGCDQIQGFVYARPKPADHLTAHLTGEHGVAPRLTHAPSSRAAAIPPPSASRPPVS